MAGLVAVATGNSRPGRFRSPASRQAVSQRRGFKKKTATPLAEAVGTESTPRAFEDGRRNREGGPVRIRHRSWRSGRTESRRTLNERLEGCQMETDLLRRRRRGRCGICAFVSSSSVRILRSGEDQHNSRPAKRGLGWQSREPSARLAVRLGLFIFSFLSLNLRTSSLQLDNFTCTSTHQDYRYVPPVYSSALSIPMMTFRKYFFSQLYSTMLKSTLFDLPIRGRVA